MQAVVKTPHIEINIRGDIIPPKLIIALKDEFGDDVKFIESDDDAMVNVVETAWYRDIKSRTTPGDNMKIYRELKGISQSRLGELLGGIPRQHISNMERGRRPISLNNARKLASLFDVPLDRFIAG